MVATGMRLGDGWTACNARAAGTAHSFVAPHCSRCCASHPRSRALCCAVLCRAATPPLQMGLGKTAQSISVLAFQKQYGGCRGPFLGECRQQAA